MYVYAYEYPEYIEEYGATITTYAIKCLDNGKYLTIQNYFSETDEEKPYYNLLGNEIYEVQAAADEVNWNERLYIDYYGDEGTGYYTVASHLGYKRDDPAFSTRPVYIGSGGLYSSKNNRNLL